MQYSHSTNSGVQFMHNCVHLTVLSPTSCSPMSTKHHPKRLRPNPPPAPDDARHNFLDTVPDEVLRIVLRHLSNRPQTQNWHPYISAHSVNTALDVGGALARAASIELRSIGGDDGFRLDTVVDDSILQLRPLVYRLRLHRLVLDLPAEDKLLDLLRGCAAELREFYLYSWRNSVTKNDIHAISTHCTKLSSLTITVRRAESPLAPIWRSLGSTLTRIHISRRLISAFSVRDLV